MPVVEGSDSRPGWAHYLLWGCGGCAVVAIILCIAGFYYISHTITRTMFSSPPPPKHSTPYAFSYHKESAHCSLTLPDKYGTLTYSHLLSNTCVYWGLRAIKVKDKAGRSQEWPLPYSHLTKVKVGIYWYHAKNGLGPYIRFYDASGSSILDLGTWEVGELYNIRGKNHIANYAYDDTQFHGCSVETDGKGNILTVKDPFGKPARDVSSAITPAKCIYLGSVVRKGNRLVFQPNPGSESHNP